MRRRAPSAKAGFARREPHEPCSGDNKKEGGRGETMGFPTGHHGQVEVA
jgi:hypothetical protein